MESGRSKVAVGRSGRSKVAMGRSGPSTAVVERSGPSKVAMGTSGLPTATVASTIAATTSRSQVRVGCDQTVSLAHKMG